MKWRKGKGLSALRRRAEQQPAAPKGGKPDVSGAGQFALVHKLQLRQLQLQKQNEDLRRARLEADELRSRYQDLYDYAPIGYFTLDEGGVILEVNLAGASLLGCERSTAVNRPFLRFLVPESIGEFEAFCRRIFTAEAQQRCEVRLGENARAGWALLDGMACTGGGEGRKTCRVALLDISEWKRVEEALQKSEKKFVKVFNAVPALLGISTLNEGRIIDVNETALQTLGYRLDEMVGRTVHELNLWEDASYRSRVLQVLEEHGSIQNLEIRFRGKTGQTFSGLFSAELIEFDGERYMLSLMKDITDRKRAEEALLRAKREWELTFDSVPDLIAILDDQYRIVRVNRAMAERLGRRPEECVGLLCYTAVHGTDSPPEFCPHAKTLADAREHDAEVRGHLGGNFLVSTTPLLDPDGKMVGVVHVARDITERKRAEEVIERLNSDQSVRAAELEAVNQELEAFNYTVAHDLRKPLTTINGYCQLMRELCVDKLDEQCKGYLQEVYDGTWRMNRLIDTLLDFSRLTRIELRREKVDLSSVVQEVAAELQLAEPARRATFRITEGISVICDASLLRVVLENLLGNAWKYTAMREEAVIEFGATELHGQPVWFVRDNGPGFAAADADKLFIPFQRLPGTEEYRGFGIGLATVDRIIRRHGGRVWAEGEPGNGATFYFTLGSAMTA